MNILFYLGHPAQYHFFKHAILELKKRRHQIFILIKTKDILEKLLISDGLTYVNIQLIARKNNSFSIFIASILRTYKVIKFSRKNKIDTLLGTDSSVAQAAFFLRKKSITTLEDDYLVIKKLCDLTYPFTNTILVPSVCDVGKWAKKKIGYEGYMKLTYLHPNIFSPSENIKKKYISDKKYMLIRIAKLTAHHDVGIKGLNMQLIKRVIEIVESAGYKVYISSEVNLDMELKQYQLIINPLDIHHILFFSSMLISDSQSMSVESAMLGVPSIRYSDFAGKISVLEELEHKYRLTFGISTKNNNGLIEKIEELISIENLREEFQRRRMKMLSDKIDVTAFLVWFIENYPTSHQITKENPNHQFYS